MAKEVKIKISEEVFEDYKKTADKWEPVLLDLPIRAAKDVLGLMTGVKGVRGKKHFGAISGHSQFAPFKRNRESEASVDIDYRTLETHPGNVVELFAPVDYSMLAMGYDDPVIGEGVKKASTTLKVLAMLCKARGESLADAAINGIRNPEGDTALDLCDGLLEILKKEWGANRISLDKGNYYEYHEDITAENAVDIAKDIVRNLHPKLRKLDSFLFCSQHFADMYNEGYLLSHPAVPYNDKYEQAYVEGSNKKLTLMPLPELEGSTWFFVTQKDNLLWGTDNESDESFVDIMRKDHYTLSFASHIWFGVQFHSIDPRKLMVVRWTPVPVEDDEPLGGE
ncbi:MAG: hypothetical protein DBY35_06505 [Bacteroidales bacterium]|nr:MAG: hypothetical protein DBY35_06505 [Bacteroidales bacterium]